MNLRSILLIAIFVVFGSYSTWLLFDIGYFGIWQAGFTSPAAIQILADLLIACLLISSWMIGDARARGINVAPWLVGVLTTGTIAILAYLIVRLFSKNKAPQTA